jgi:acyl carrier protein
VGAQALSAVVGSDLEQAAVTINDWTAFASQFTTPPRVFEEVLPASAASGKAEAGPDLGALAAQAQSGDPAERRAAVTSVIAQQVMSTLGLTKAVDTTRPLRELGLDSLMAVTLINRVEAALSVRIPAVTLIQGPSIDHLVDGLWPELKNAGPPPVRPKAVEAAPAAALRAAPAEVIRDIRPALPVFTPARPDTSAYGMASNGTASNGAAGYGVGGNGAASNGAASDAWSGNGAGSWLVPVARRANPRLRLFCFPFAGGGSAVFRDWGAGLDPSIEVVAIEPPGRLSRINERPVHDLKVFVDRVLKEMDTKTDLPFALFGHCLGGLTMYEVARRLIDERGIMPRHIFASGARAPDTVQDVGPFEKKLGRALMEMPGYQPDLPPYRQSEAVLSRAATPTSRVRMSSAGAASPTNVCRSTCVRGPITRSSRMRPSCSGRSTTSC